ncbi:uncharacterized protein LOC122534652 [Frieseomelitta varia]|uniref:uncharacterized protein LOC122534652 n=1 Tax=Frieseomelitta varia TaxID=561572 RepID=UPI001CB6AEA3|nr:uncharacterized protein LOC122534652 [Frieseomelitta varia]
MANRSTSRAHATEPANTGTVTKARVSVSPFWSDEPDLWFRHIEEQFAWNMTDQAKYSFVLAHIGSKHAKKVSNVIWNPPDKNRYDTLKKELIRNLCDLKSQRIQRLLEREVIGDRTPSQFLQHMRTLAGKEVTDEFLRMTWVNRLPSTIRAIITPMDYPLNELATIADRIQEISPKVASISRDTENDKRGQELKELRNNEVTDSKEPLLVSQELRRPSDQVPIAMQLCVGKRGNRTLSAAISDEPKTSRFFVTDKAMATEFLVDTGSDLCVFPHTRVKGQAEKSTYEMYVANGTTISTYSFSPGPSATDVNPETGKA